MITDRGAVIILSLLVSVSVIVAFFLTLAGGLEWVVDRLRERRRRQRVARAEKGESDTARERATLPNSDYEPSQNFWASRASGTSQKIEGPNTRTGTPEILELSATSGRPKESCTSEPGYPDGTQSNKGPPPFRHWHNGTSMATRARRIRHATGAQKRAPLEVLERRA
jgi:hypothetical protein